MFTDPPYNVPIDGHVCGLGRIRHADFAMGCGEMSEAEFTGFLEAVFRQLAANTVDGSIHQICMDWRHMPEMLAAGNAVYQRTQKPVRLEQEQRRDGHVLSLQARAGVRLEERHRPAHQHLRAWPIRTVSIQRVGLCRGEQPQAGPARRARHASDRQAGRLVADAIKDCSRRNGIVLDPFAGSGTVLIAAERTGRRARALEIDPHYVDVAVRRWEDYTGKAAVLAATGSTFEEISEERTAAAPAPTPAFAADAPDRAASFQQASV